jgi:hypothetical protein
VPAPTGRRLCGLRRGNASGKHFWSGINYWKKLVEFIVFIFKIKNRIMTKKFPVTYKSIKVSIKKILQL